MTHYLIEIRFSGKSKQYLKDLIYDVSNRFNVRGATKKPPVPHISLAGPLFTNNESRLVSEIIEIAKNYDMIKFSFDGIGKFGNWLTGNRVIKINIKPSQELQELRLKISEQLKEFCKLTKFDTKKDFEFHATIAFKDIDKKFGDIWKYLSDKEIPNWSLYVIRVTIIKDQRILCEYDLMQRKKFLREDAKDKNILRKSIKIVNGRKPLSKDFWDIPDSSKNGEIFLISDTHFDHENIIRYCNRPFKSVDEMNKTLIDRWNSKVGKEDTVYFMGDLTLEREKLDYWLGKLNGKIKFIRGNHDKGQITKAEEMPNRYPLVCREHKFLLTHDPIRPSNWDGWLIHGDKHNNSLDNYPFMNHEKKTVNICSELVGYAPISLDTIILNLSKNEQKNYRYYEGEADHQNSGHDEDHKHKHQDRRHRTRPQGSRREHENRHQYDRRDHKNERHEHRRDHRHEQNTQREQSRERVHSPTHYEILGIQKNATPDEIKTAFRKSILKWHSDKNKIEDADEYTKILYEAKEVLLDPVKRRQYDRTI